ncbi:hypothetical protein [Roseococcus sp.]|uniref:hypothetical protein n=1 Tax=Roseococcus sp. TaxID=2109646 RepID=UPI003BACDA21
MIVRLPAPANRMLRPPTPSAFSAFPDRHRALRAAFRGPDALMPLGDERKQLAAQRELRQPDQVALRVVEEAGAPLQIGRRLQPVGLDQDPLESG